MGTYSPYEVLLPVGLDELGLKLALDRIPSETLSNYRRRLLLEVRDPSGPEQDSFIRSLNRKVGKFDQPVMEINLILDSNSNPLAVDPFIEVTSTHFRAYYDHDNAGLDIELSFTDGSRWLLDVQAALALSTYFTVTTLDDYSAYLEADHIRYDNSDRFKMQIQLFRSYQNSLKHSNLKEIWFSNLQAFQESKSTVSAVIATGDYFVDMIDGVILTHSTQGGNCSYTYREFPYILYWQTCRAVPMIDADLAHLHKDYLVEDSTGLEVPLNLNSVGSDIINKILIVHPLGWGE